MNINFNLGGADRKPLVKAVSKITGHPAVYLKVPTCACQRRLIAEAFGLNVFIAFYKNEQLAADRMVVRRNGRQHTHIVNDNGINVVLFHSQRLGNPFHTDP